MKPPLLLALLAFAMAGMFAGLRFGSDIGAALFLVCWGFHYVLFHLPK